ncbi:MAG: hypothetical protein KDC98_22805 [Planctomycetes bacterium]|nr:hypothetical protein [Planctomycetota bacterium]
MKKHAIVEIEEGALTLTVGGSDGRGKLLRILSCDRFPLPEATTDTVRAALGALGSAVLQGGGGVHVIVGDRRAHHFVSEVPRMRPEEAVQVMVREGLRVSGAPTAADLLIAPRLLRCEHGGTLVIGAAALPAGVWQPLRSAFESSGMSVSGVHTMESCLALAAAGTAGNTAVLECSPGRARFVLCDAGAPVQVRRFILGGGGDTDSAALVAQLALELPRTFDWLRESGKSLPKTMVLGSRLRLDGDSTEMLRGDLEGIERPAVRYELADGAIEPGLATLMLLSRLADGEPLPSLLSAPTIRIPFRRSRVWAIAAMGLFGLALSWSAIVDVRAGFEVEDEVARTDAERLRLEQDLTGLEAIAAPLVETALERKRLDAALGMRRPVSRLIAEISNCATDAIHLESLQFASTATVAVGGVVKGSSRKAALEALTGFVDRLRTLSYLDPDGRDEVSEVPGASNCLRFRIVMSWGRP